MKIKWSWGLVIFILQSLESGVCLSNNWGRDRDILPRYELGASQSGRRRLGYFYDTTSRGWECDDPCSNNGGTSYFWCHVTLESSSWDYCSPAIGMDYMSRPCSTYCGYVGQRYKWCNVGQGRDWGYCSDAYSRAESPWTTQNSLFYSLYFAILTLIFI